MLIDFACGTLVKYFWLHYNRYLNITCCPVMVQSRYKIKLLLDKLIMVARSEYNLCRMLIRSPIPAIAECFNVITRILVLSKLGICETSWRHFPPNACAAKSFSSNNLCRWNICDHFVFLFTRLDVRVGPKLLSNWCSYKLFSNDRLFIPYYHSRNSVK